MDKTILLIDIGNSTAVFADYANRKLRGVKRLTTQSFLNTWHTMGLEKYKKIIVSSVVPKADIGLKTFKNCIFVTYKNIPDLVINLKKPHETGADRLINALAAYTSYHKDCLIIDSGTALTFCVVDKHGVYQGGAIVPGMKIGIQALKLYTAKLPLINVKPQKELIGKTTKEAMQIGLYQGYISLINGMIHAYKKLNPKLFVIGTGKGLACMEHELTIDIYDPLLTLKGLEIFADNALT
ncbi:type III pantothenate kinase [Thermoproteota archaeon]